MSTPTKVQFQFSTAAMPAPELWFNQVFAVDEDLTTELGVTAEDPALISLVGLDHPRVLFVQTTGTAAMTVTYGDDTEMVVTGDILVLGFDPLETNVPTDLKVELPTPPDPEEGEEAVVYDPIRVYVRMIGV